MKRNVSLFRNGRNQAVRIPREFELPDRRAIMRKEGALLIIEPAAKPSLLDAIDGLPSFTEDEGLDPIDDLPLDPVEL